MAEPISVDLRERVCEAVLEGFAVSGCGPVQGKRFACDPLAGAKASLRHGRADACRRRPAIGVD
jgi:hypothetical protein